MTCTQCFLHVINLVTKTLIHVFDLPKKKGATSWEGLNDELKKLGEDLKLEEPQTQLEAYQTRMESGDEAECDLVEDNVDRWVDEADFLTKEECTELKAQPEPL